MARYARDLLVAVLVNHQRDSIEGCHCGWRDLGKSWAEHVANCYEAALGGPSLPLKEKTEAGH